MALSSQTLHGLVVSGEAGSRHHLSANVGVEASSSCQKEDTESSDDRIPSDVLGSGVFNTAILELVRDYDQNHGDEEAREQTSAHSAAVQSRSKGCCTWQVGWDAGQTKTRNERCDQEDIANGPKDFAKAAGLDAKQSEDVHGDALPSFTDDLGEWVRVFSERFHVKIFVLEMVGQGLFTIAGPLALPAILYIYGSANGLRNRGFYPDTCNGFVTQSLLAIPVCCALFTWFMYRPTEVMLIEPKFWLITAVMRTITIAIKYAFMTSAGWEQLNTQFVSESRRTWVLIIRSWLLIKPVVAELEAQIAFISALGSRKQRQKYRAKFVGWPRSQEELVRLRERVDATSKAMYFKPTGEISGRKAVTRPYDFSDRDAPLPTVPPTPSSSPVASMRISEISSQLSHDYHGRAKGAPQVTNDSADAATFAAAASGETVQLEDLFMYILRSVLRAEKHVVPFSALVVVCNIFAFGCTLAPTIMRALAGMPPLGSSVSSRVVIVGMWLDTLRSLQSCSLFVAAAAVDMWRRRALMRVCSALLSVDRKDRRYCPPEVDMLPILDLADIATLESWRKLRQLCMCWGAYFHHRIIWFSSTFLAGSLIMVLDMLAAMNMHSYADFIGLSLTDFVQLGMFGTVVLTCVFVLIYFGDDVNGSASRHTHILQRQRMLFTAMRHSVASMDETLDISQDIGEEKLARASDYLEVLIDDIEAEHRVRPVKVLGLYCGYILLSTLQAVPVGMAASFLDFCSAEKTAWRCRTLATGWWHEAG